MGRGWPVALCLLVAVVMAGPALAAPVGERPVSEQQVYEVASQLRCVVCQNLSVADSPSEMASQMRDLVRERLASGETPAQVVRYFVDKYGQWILLEPRRSGFTLLVWIFPFVAVAVGLGIVAVMLRRWTRRPAAPAPPVPVDPEMSARIRRELETE